ncbi:NfeD family protein [uncultured Desulfovibrio sp.]|uniref:NfeD family protein n=1 Tax=uncultured Desulfovibrio sp. TaxID=167968 RepID=UPI00272A6413|nr:NfeD family protein [uncultured Desulfovibrio sp.]
MNAPLLWFLLGLFFLFVELLAPTLVLVFFGAGAWVTACAALLGLSLGWQLVLFILVSLLTLLLLRRHLRAVFGGRAQRAADADAQGGQAPSHPLTGRAGVVSKALRPGEVGEVSIDGSFWRAVAEVEIHTGRTVRVLGTQSDDALLLRVTATEKH